MAVTSCLTATSSKSKPRPGLMQNQAPGKATRGKLTKVVIPNDEGRQSDLWRWAWFLELHPKHPKMVRYVDTAIVFAPSNFISWTR